MPSSISSDTSIIFMPDDEQGGGEQQETKQISDLKKQVQELKNVVNAKDSELLEMNAKNENLEKKVAELEDQLDEAKNDQINPFSVPDGDSEQGEKKMERELEAELEELNAKNKNLERELVELKDQLGTQKSQFLEVNAKNVNLEKEVAELKNEVKNNQRYFKAMGEPFCQLAMDNAMSIYVEEMEKRCGGNTPSMPAELFVKEHEQCMSKAMHSFNDHKKFGDTNLMEKFGAKLKKEIEAKRVEYEMDREMEELKQKREELERKVEELKRKVEEVKRKGEEREREVEELKRKGEELKRKVEEVKRKGEERERKAEEMKRKREEWERKAEEMKRKREEMKEMADEMKEKVLEEMVREAEEMKEEMDRWAKEMEEIE